MRRILLILGLALTTTLTPRAAYAVKVADITRLAGARTNFLTGMGLVVGLKGTGDGGKFLPAIKPLAQMLGKFANPASVVDLADANNVAIVMVTATMPRDGVRQGDALDVRVMTVGGATSLRGGTLYMAPLVGPNALPYTPHDAQGRPMTPIPYAMANGPVEMDDPTVPTSGVVRGAAVMEVDLPAKYVDRLGRFTLILDGPSASWTMASTIADRINQLVDTNEVVAVAVDPKNVVVRVPTADRERPDLFISQVQRLTVPMLPGEARVRIDDKTGAMVASGDVEIAPFLVTYRGLTISSVAPAPPAAGASPASQRGTVPLDPAGSGAARMRDLADAFDQLKVPAEDRIHIMKELYENGELHAKLIVDGAEK